MREALLDTDPADVAEFELARAEVATWQLARAAAEQMGSIVRVLREAQRHPEVFVNVRGGEPTAGELQIAQDAAVADLAVRLAMSESAVLGLARQGELVKGRAPRVWGLFREGEVSPAQVRVLAGALESLPEAAGTDARLEDAAIGWAGLPPARFRERLRTLVERLHPDSLAERHAAARRRRAVWLDPRADGMADLGIHLPAGEAELAWQRIDATARHLAERAEESRTLDELRADVASDLLTGRHDPATAPRITVGVMVPVLSLLDEAQTPASLEGRVPIDPDTARRLAGEATSFHRILTDPIAGTVVDVDRRSYRVPADLKRLLAVRDVRCRFPGCGTPAKRCDLDHSVDWAHGGPTSARNLAHVSERHHTLKHRSKWRMQHHPDGRITWTSPTGHTSTSDPPPF